MRRNMENRRHCERAVQSIEPFLEIEKKIRLLLEPCLTRGLLDKYSGRPRHMSKRAQADHLKTTIRYRIKSTRVETRPFISNLKLGYHYIIASTSLTCHVDTKFMIKVDKRKD